MLYSKYINPFGLRFGLGKPGRPRLSASKRKTARVVVRFTKRQLTKLQSEADDADTTLAELVRQRSLQKRKHDSDGLEFLDLPRHRSRRRASFWK